MAHDVKQYQSLLEPQRNASLYRFDPPARTQGGARADAVHREKSGFAMAGRSLGQLEHGAGSRVASRADVPAPTVNSRFGLAGLFRRGS